MNLERFILYGYDPDQCNQAQLKDVHNHRVHEDLRNLLLVQHELFRIINFNVEFLLEASTVGHRGGDTVELKIFDFGSNTFTVYALLPLLENTERENFA